MASWKLILILALAVSAIANVMFLYKILDSAVTLDHAQSSFKSYQEREVILSRLAKSYVASMSEKEFREWLRNNAENLNVSDQADQIIINGVEFRIENGHARLTR